MGPIERRIAREAKAMTKEQVFVKALEKRISWLQAGDIIGVTPRHMRRIRWSVERYGMDVLKDGRSGSRRKRIPGSTSSPTATSPSATWASSSPDSTALGSSLAAP
jgi:hypothetical protein